MDIKDKTIEENQKKIEQLSKQAAELKVQITQ